MRVAIYVRVSTDMQRDEGYSLDAQRDRCKAYCISQGWEVVLVYVEEGKSAKDMNRSELQRMLKDTESGLFDIILVYKLDRLTRSVKDLNELLDLFEKNNVKFRSATEVYDTTTAMGKLFITIVAALAEWERGNLSERVRFGMEQLVTEGKWPGGPVAFGYSWDGTTMHIVEEEEKILHELRRLYMSGKGFGSISKMLNAAGLQRRGFRWSSQTVSSVLHNPLYAGKIRYGGKDKFGKYVTSKKEERVTHIWSDSGFPVIYTWEEYEEHNAAMKKKQFYGHSRKREYWYSGVLRCARCGSTLFGRPYRNPHKNGAIDPGVVNYICSSRANNMGCNMPLLRQSLATVLIDEYIREIRFRQEQLEASVVKSKKIKNSNAQELETLKKDLKVIGERRKKWQYMFADELMSEADFKARKREEDEMESVTRERIEHLKSEDVGISASFAQLMYSLPEIWEKLDDSTKKETMQTIFERIIIECDVPSGKGVSGKGKILPFRIVEVNFN